MDSKREIEIVSPFPLEEYPRVWLWTEQAGSSLLNDIGPQDMESFVDDWLGTEDRPGRAYRALSWGVMRDGVLGGWIVYEPIAARTGNAHCVFKKGKTKDESFFGYKTTIPALTQVAEDLFAIGIERIGMVVFETNRAIQGLLKQLGAETEAVWFNPRTLDGQPITVKGEVVPMIQYGLYRESFGRENPRGFTYNDWIRQLVAREIKRTRTEDTCQQHSRS